MVTRNVLDLTVRGIRIGPKVPIAEGWVISVQRGRDDEEEMFRKQDRERTRKRWNLGMFVEGSRESVD